ncbi:MAG: hypothetical protein AAF989_08810 [Planctomycetota bacterium]
MEGNVELLETVDGIAPAEALQNRSMHADLRVEPDVPDDTRLWAALQQVGGGTWGGCVYDVDKIIETLERGSRVTDSESPAKDPGSE